MSTPIQEIVDREATSEAVVQQPSFNRPAKEWYEQTFASAYLRGLRRGLSHEEAQDTAAESANKIWKQTAFSMTPVRFSEDGFPCNLFRVEQSAFNDYLRHAHMQGPVIDLDTAVARRWIKDYPQHAVSTLEALAHVRPQKNQELDLLAHDVKAIIESGKIDAETKSILTAWFFENKSIRMIALEHGISPTTVRFMINRVIHRLRAEYAA